MNNYQNVKHRLSDYLIDIGVPLGLLGLSGIALAHLANLDQKPKEIQDPSISTSSEGLDDKLSSTIQSILKNKPEEGYIRFHKTEKGNYEIEYSSK